MTQSSSEQLGSRLKEREREEGIEGGEKLKRLNNERLKWRKRGVLSGAIRLRCLRANAIRTHRGALWCDVTRAGFSR